MSRHRVAWIFRRYGLAVGVTGAALACTHILSLMGYSGIFPLFFCAVVISAWFGGLGPGLFATGLSTLVSALYLLPAGHSYSVERDDVLRLSVFLMVSLVTSMLQSAIRRAAAAERAARQAAENTNLAKNRFIAAVSHELRTPLSPILMATQLLEADPTICPDSRELVQTIRKSLDIEVRLIDDLLDISRAGTGKLRLKLEPLDVRRPLESAIDVLRDQLSQKHLELDVQIQDGSDDQTWAQVIGDHVRLQQVFWNLLRNAIKFTPAGGKIAVVVQHCGASVSISISDTGIGIDPSQLEAIFEAFEQVGQEVADRAGGMGLGLAITRALVSAHGGKIAASSLGPGKGATFTVSLPLASSQRAPATPGERRFALA